jgi:hypothetical protein
MDENNKINRCNLINIQESCSKMETIYFQELEDYKEDDDEIEIFGSINLHKSPNLLQ